MIAFDSLNLKQMYDDLFYAQRQHYSIVEAIEWGEGARAEALFREHVNTQKHSMNLRPVRETTAREKLKNRRSKKFDKPSA